MQLLRHEDIEAANVNNVKDFFANFYLPNNCSLVVAGDFKSAEIKPLVAKLFGTVARGAPVVRREPKDWPQPQLGKVVRVTMLDKVELPRITFVYHSPRQYQEGDAEMNLGTLVVPTGAATGAAGFLDHAPRAFAGGAGLRDAEDAA